MQQLEINFINQTCQDLEKLNGTEFEYLSKDILALILNENIIHKGHNLYAKPVKSTADFNTDDFEVVGQCGTDNNYFTSLTKPIKDIDSAINNHQQCKIIYLFANQRGTGGKLSKLNIKIEKNYSQTINIFDSEKIAKEILKNILNHKIEKLLMEYLPTTYEIYKLLPQTNNIPNFTSKKYFRRNTENEIKNKLLDKKILQIFGISGVGKTETVKSIASDLLKEFESIIWINEVNSQNFNFESVYIQKFNSQINVKTLLENHRVILILDNFNENIKNIKKYFLEYNKKSSICIITSLQQDLSEDFSYNIGYMDYETSKKILFETEYKPLDDIANKIIKHIDGYPLLLNIIRDSIENKDYIWEEILDDIKDIVRIDDSEKNKKISIRIMEKQLPSIKDEIKWIFLLNKRLLAKEYLKFSINKIGIQKLIKRSIVSDTESYFYTIHQIVLDSIIDILKDKISLLESHNKLFEFLQTENEKKSVAYFNFLFTHKDFIDRVYNSLDNNEPLKKQILYSKIQARDANDSKWFLKEINNYTITENNKIDILLLVEKVEIELYNAKKEFKEINYDKYAEICKNKIVILEQLSSKCKIENINLYLNHHIGKIYSRIKNYSKALELFEMVINKDNSADYAKLQIARIFSWNKEKMDDERLKQIFEEIFCNPNAWEKQSLSVLLAMYDLLSKNNMSKYRKKYIDDSISDFLNRLFYSLTFGFEQPFQLLSNLSYHLSYHHKDVYSEICENLPLPSTIEVNDESKFAFATIQVAYYRNLKYSNIQNKDEKMKRAFNYAKTYYKSINLNDYQRGKFVDLYIESQNFSEALDELEQYTQKDDAFYLQKLSKVYRGLKQYKKSLQAIKKAIEFLEVNGNKNYLSAFLNDKAETLFANNNLEDAIKNLKEAINIQKNTYTLKSWNKKLKDWENSQQTLASNR